MRLTVALHGGPLDAVCAEDVHVHELRLAHELKHDLAHLVQGVHRQTALLLQLPAGRGGRGREGGRQGMVPRPHDGREEELGIYTQPREPPGWMGDPGGCRPEGVSWS